MENRSATGGVGFASAAATAVANIEEEAERSGVEVRVGVEEPLWSEDELISVGVGGSIVMVDVGPEFLLSERRPLAKGFIFVSSSVFHVLPQPNVGRIRLR